MYKGIHCWHFHHDFRAFLKGYFLQIGSAAPTLLLCYLLWEDYVFNLSTLLPILSRNHWSFFHPSCQMPSSAQIGLMSLWIILTVPLLLINCQSAWMKLSVVKLLVTSMCTALLHNYVNIAPYLFWIFQPSLTKNGPNMSTPQKVKGGSSESLSAWRFPIFCWHIFLHSFLHSTHLDMNDLTALRAWSAGDVRSVYLILGTPIWTPKSKVGRRRKTNILHKNKKLPFVTLFSRLNIAS